jgi:methylmalonyl-CoA/ethylmalonyl-CoA epimerase
MIIDHIAIVVRSIKESREKYENFLGFRPVTDIIPDPIQKVNVQFLANEKGERLELIEPTDETSPSMNALKKGGGANHISYRCSDLDAVIEEAKKQKIKVVCPPVPGTGHDGRRIAFFVHPHLGLLEFVERKENQEET